MAEDIQQQIADGARPLAKVDDVIAHGEAIAANVVRLADADGDDWVRDTEPDRWRCEGSTLKDRPSVWMLAQYGPMTVVTVVEVDPEPQPADPLRCPTCGSPQPSMHPALSGGGEVSSVCSDGFHAPGAFDADGYLQLKGTATGDNQLDVPQPAKVIVPDHLVGDGPCHDCGAVNIRWFAESPVWNRVMGGPDATDDPGGILCVRCFVIRADRAGFNPSAWLVTLPVDHARRLLASAATAESIPVLSLPQVPDGAVALRGGARWVRSGDFPDMWVLADGGSTLHCLGALLDREEGSVTVEFAPPRERRTWPKLENSISDLPDVVEVHLTGIWKRREGSTLFQQGETWRTLAQLRELGEVREVLT